MYNIISTNIWIIGKPICVDSQSWHEIKVAIVFSSLLFIINATIFGVTMEAHFRLRAKNKIKQKIVRYEVAITRIKVVIMR